MASSISPHTEDDYVISLVKECCGQNAKWNKPELIPPKDGMLTRQILFTFNSEQLAERVLAVMNHHPALAGHGVSFSRPDERIYPEIRTLCTRRIIEAVGTSGQEYDYKREKWMDKIGWPQGFPSPSRAYIELSKDKPIHHTSIELSPDEEWWDIVVQYFRPESAEELDRSGLKELLGFSVEVYKDPGDERALKDIMEINALRRARNLPPLGEQTEYVILPTSTPI